MSKYYIKHYGFADENYLEHYGVLGMRWGVRKAEDIRNDAANKRMNFENVVYAKKYRDGEITKEEYKSHKLKNKEKYKQKKIKNEMLKRRQIASYKKDKKAFKDKYKNKRDIVSAAYNDAKKEVHNYKDLAAGEAKMRSASLAGQLTLGLVGNIAMTAIFSGDYNKAYEEGYQVIEDIINKNER